MSDAQEMYEHAMQQTGMDDPAEALDALIDSYGKDEYEETYDEDYEDVAEFEIGDTVQLHSGGPLMTIKEVHVEFLICRWFNKDDNLQSAEFNIQEICLGNNLQKESSDSQQSFTKENSIPEIDIDEDEIPF